MKKRRLHVPAVIAATVAAAAIGGSLLAVTSSAAAGRHATSHNVVAHAAAASKPTLVVYSAQGYDKAMVTAFTKATGIPTKLDDNSTGPLLTQIEASKNNPNWGLLWVDGDTAFAGLDKQGLLMRGFEPKVSWDKLGASVVPTDKSYTPTGITLMAAEVYNSKVVKKAPTSWNQLLNPVWSNAIGMNDPAQSGPTFPFVAGMMSHLGSIAAGEKYFTTLRRNGILINATNGPTLQALTTGQIKIALVQSSAAIGAALTDKSLRVKYLNPVTLLPSAIGIDAKAPKAVQQEAEQFISFVLSKQGQKVMQTGDPTGDSLYYPVLQGVKPLKALPSLNSVKTQRLNPYVWGPREASINTWFDNNIK